MSKKFLIQLFILFFAFSMSASSVSANMLPLTGNYQILPVPNIFLIFTFTFINMIIEMTLLISLGWKERKVLLSAIFANIISWPIFAYYINNDFSNKIFLIEGFVIVFESLFIYLFNRKLGFRNIFYKILAANITSIVLGTMVGFILVLILFSISLH